MTACRLRIEQQGQQCTVDLKEAWNINLLIPTSVKNNAIDLTRIRRLFYFCPDLRRAR